MNRKDLKRIIRNQGRLLFIAFPCFFLFVWIQAIVNQDQGRFKIGYVIETGAFYYLAAIFNVAIGGLFHTLIIESIPLSLNEKARRVAVFGFSPIIPITLIIIGERVETITGFLLPIILMLCIYSALFKLKQKDK
jgi:hypothetical protein